MFASYLERRKRRHRIFDSDDEEPGFFQNENEDEQDGDSDFPSGRSQKRISGKAFKASKGASAQRTGQNSVSSAPPTKTKNHPRQDELAEFLETRNEATTSSLQIDGQAEGGDEDGAICDGPRTPGSSISTPYYSHTHLAEGLLLTSWVQQLRRPHAATESDLVDPSLASTE